MHVCHLLQPMRKNHLITKYKDYVDEKEKEM